MERDLKLGLSRLGSRAFARFQRRPIPAVLAFWTVLLAFFLVLISWDQKRQVETLALKEAQSAFEKDVLYRKWGAKQGGVYVPITPETPPNPYLKVKDRDVVTTKGQRLTLMNPAYMVRQVYALAQQYGNRVQGHLTSLRPINPINAPDSWERKVLQLFEKGVQEYWEILRDSNGDKVLRFMRPFIVEKPCLKCHGYQGYKVGDIRGGISITVSLGPYYALLRKRLYHIGGVFLTIWALGVLFLTYAIRKIQRYHQEQERLKERMAHMQKLEALGTLVGGIAHDFNNILTVINGHLEILLSKIPSSDPLYSRLRAIKKAGDTATNIVSQLMTFARSHTVQEERLDLNQIVEGLKEMLEHLVREDIKVEYRLAPSLPKIKISKARLEQVILNLVSNAQDAIRAAPGNPRKILIETGTRVFGPKVVSKHPEVKPGTAVFLAVSDTGVGMDQKTLERIFDPFFTTKELGRGTGLGLATVYGVVTQSGGWVEVESEPGRGTRFEIYWPATAEEEEASLGPEEPPEETLRPGQERILLVEDDPDIREFTSSALELLGYQVYQAADGLEAWQKIQEGLKVDLIISDLIMPQMDGKELLEKVKEIAPETKFILISGYTKDYLEGYTLPPGVTFLQKPYSVKALSQEIRLLLDQKP